MAVYTAYDHLPLEQKETPFLVLNLSAYDTEPAVQRGEQTVIPFSAVVTVTLLLPPSADVQALYGMFTEHILPALLTRCRVQTMKLAAPKLDGLLQKQTMTVHCTVLGCCQPAEQEV